MRRANAGAGQRHVQHNRNNPAQFVTDAEKQLKHLLYGSHQRIPIFQSNYKEQRLCPTGERVAADSLLKKERTPAGRPGYKTAARRSFLFLTR